MKDVQNLAETIHSLLGMKDHLTPGWVDSVCDIAKRLNSTGSPARLKYEELEAEERSFSSVEKIDNSLIISKIKDDIELLSTRINELSLQRRQALNEYLDLKGNIRVFCLMRPAVGENLGLTRPIVAPDSSKIFLQVLGSTLNSRSYSFDRVFQTGSSQDEVFMEVEPITKSALDGYNACIFAYGQTGTGKTFTMEGNSDNPGVVPRTIQALFKQASTSNHKYLFSFSMLEIYLGNLKDLLVPHPMKPTDPMPPNLTIQTDPRGGIDIENLVAIPVSDHNQALQLYKLGCRFRSIASTNSNLNSSRSHCLIRISITCPGAPERRRERNKVWLIDLGGSERVMKTKASGRRLDEGKAINLSLSALADVIYALQMKKSHIPYRNTKLTQVLKDSLGEDSKTLMLVHVSPKEEDLCETICTLNFAARVRSIHLGNKGPMDKAQKEAAMGNLQAMIAGIERDRQELRDEMEDLQGKLRSLSGIDPSCCEYEYLTPEAPKGNPDIMKNKSMDGRAALSSKLPGFMRPTLSSKKKTGKDQQTFDEKQLFPARRRSAPSNRAKSIAFPMKTGSEYTSDCSISGASCMLDLNVKNSETEHSIDTSECDIKTVVFSEEKKPETGYKLFNKYSKQHQKVDKWLKSRDGRSAAGVSRNRLVPASPLPMKHRGNIPSRAEALQTAKYFKTKEINKYSGEFIVDEVASTISTVEVEIDVALVRPSDEDQELDMDDCFDDYHPDTGDDPVPETIYSRQNDLKTGQLEEVHISESSLKSESCHQEVVFKEQMQDTRENEFELERRTKVLDLKSLYTNHANQNNANAGTRNVGSSTMTRRTGIFHLLREKIQIICTGALLGLQLQNLGFGDEFFGGLMR